MKNLWQCPYCGVDARGLTEPCCETMKRDVEDLEEAFWGTNEERAKRVAPSIRYWITPDPDYQI